MEKKNIAPVKPELLITVVDKKKAEFYVDLIQSFDANIQISVNARGTADQEILRYIGLSDTEKTAIFSIVRQDMVKPLMETLDEKFRTIKNGKGVSAAVPFTSMIGTLLFGFVTNDRRLTQGEKK